MSSDLYKRYVLALIELAEDEKALKKVESDLADLAAMLNDSKDFSRFVAAPQISKAKQMAVIGDVVKKAKLQKITHNFLGVLVENGRLNVLGQIIKAFYKELSQRRGEEVAIVKVAQDLTLKQKKDLQTALSKTTGVDVALDVRVSPEILGGMVITIGSTMIDDSVARKLERLKLNMANKVAA